MTRKALFGIFSVLIIISLTLLLTVPSDQTHPPTSPLASNPDATAPIDRVPDQPPQMAFIIPTLSPATGVVSL